MPPLYRRLLGERFDRLPDKVRQLHDVTALRIWAGFADVERGTSLACRLIAALLSLPPPGREQTLRVVFVPAGEAELWARDFGGSVFRSVQFERDGALNETVGIATLAFDLVTTVDALSLELRGVRVLGVALPRALRPLIATRETERDGRYRFEVEARFPYFGLLIRYAGWLEKVGLASA